MFEQRDVCRFCGAERFRHADPDAAGLSQCCHNGKLLLPRQLPQPLLNIIAKAPGLSKQSRAANDLFRLAQMALPKGATPPALTA